MTPAKKAAKKNAAKSANHPAKHHPGKHREGNDLRRAYEHLGRLQVLRATLPASTRDALSALTKLAQNEIESGQDKNGAEILRACEHLGFASLADANPAIERISAKLEHSITEQFHELTRKADEHWEKHEGHTSTLSAFYLSSRKSAAKALQSGAYHQALEFARAAEAIAHVKQNGPHALATGHTNLKLKGA